METDDAKLDEAWMAAVRAMSLEPGTCSREGCGETLACVALEAWDGKGGIEAIPPPRFGCPEHDVWLGHCFDSGDKNSQRYSGGLFEGRLKDPSDPAWRWLPEHLRPAAARAGFCARRLYVYPDKFVGPWRGRAWATDRANIIRIGDAADLPAVESRFGIKVTPASKLPEVLAEHRLTEEKFDSVLRLLVEKDYRELPRTKPGDAGHSAKWDDHVAFGAAVMPPWAMTMVEEMFPGCTWRATGRVEPVFAVLDEEIVAAVMPVDVAKAEQLMREEAELEREVAAS